MYMVLGINMFFCTENLLLYQNENQVEYDYWISNSQDYCKSIIGNKYFCTENLLLYQNENQVEYDYCISNSQDYCKSIIGNEYFFVLRIYCFTKMKIKSNTTIAFQILKTIANQLLGMNILLYWEFIALPKWKSSGIRLLRFNFSRLLQINYWE